MHDHPEHWPAGPGDNAKGALQWQTPHLTHEAAAEPPVEPERDFDLVEAAFVEGFARAPDAPSFLRLAGVPFVGETGAGERLHLLRVETEERVDVASLTPGLGGGAVRFAPLPARLASRRRHLAFVYHDGTATRRLGLAEARTLAERTERPDAARLPLGQAG